MESEGILENGCMWRVCNGRNIHVLWDKWIPNIPGEHILEDEEQYVKEDMMVHKIFNEEAGLWNNDLLDNLFSPPHSDLHQSNPENFEVEK